MARKVDIATDKNFVDELDETLKSCREVEKYILATKNNLNIPGIDDNEFLNTTFEVLEPTLANELSKIFKEFKDGILDVSVLQRVLNKVYEYKSSFKNLEQYIWILKLYCKCLLIRNKNVEYDYSIEESRLRHQVLQINTESFTFCPIKIHIIAKALFESVLTDNLNLIYVINKLATMNKFLFFVSITLVFGGLFRLTKRKIKMFRMYSSKKVLKILKGLHIENPQQRMDYMQFYAILRCVSCYQHLVLYHVSKRNDFEREYRGFIEYFKHDEKVLSEILDWLHKSKHFIDSIRSKTGFNTAETIFFHIFELIELDMAYMMELKNTNQLTKYGYNF